MRTAVAGRYHAGWRCLWHPHGRPRRHRHENLVAVFIIFLCLQHEQPCKVSSCQWLSGLLAAVLGCMHGYCVHCCGSPSKQAAPSATRRPACGMHAVSPACCEDLRPAALRPFFCCFFAAAITAHLGSCCAHTAWRVSCCGLVSTKGEKSRPAKSPTSPSCCCGGNRAATTCFWSSIAGTRRLSCARPGAGARKLLMFHTGKQISGCSLCSLTREMLQHACSVRAMHLCEGLKKSTIIHCSDKLPVPGGAAHHSLSSL